MSGLVHRTPYPVSALLIGATVLTAVSVCAQPRDFALSFTDSGYVDLGDPGDVFDFDPNGGRSYLFWVRHDTTLYHAKLLDKRTKGGPGATGVFGFTIFVQQFTGTLGIYLTPIREIPRPDAFIGTVGLRPVIDKTWHHVAIVQDGDEVRGYVDGVLDFSYAIPAALLVTDKPLWIGWNSRDVVHFRGELDELSIWGRALSPSEIRGFMYDRPEPGHADLTGYWPFDEEDPGLVRDESGNGYHGVAYHVNRVGASRPLRPPFRKTIWFWTVVGLGVVAFVGVVSWLSAARLRRRNRQLEQLVRERTAEVEMQTEELKTLDAAKSRFFANISHEFRTPLTISLGLLDDLVAGRRGGLANPVKSDLLQVTRNNRILLRLVNQLLDIARIEAHQLTLQIRSLDLSDAMRAIGAAFQSVAERDSIDFELDLPDAFPVWLDPEQTELIVTNLLSNAFKYTPSGGRVALEARSVGDKGSEIALICVSDTGPGIPADRLPHIFDRFYQSDDSHQQIGTGIGLSFVKEVVELHGGSVTAESAVGSGTAISVRLPASRKHYDGLAGATVSNIQPPDRTNADDDLAEALSTVVDERSGISVVDRDAEDKKTVLIVDDNGDIRAFIRRHLDGTYRVEEAVDGLDALEIAGQSPPDLVIADVMMPRLDGFGLVERMRADPELDFVPVILLTARVEENDRLLGLGLGADAYLTKPFSTEELLLRVHNAIGRQRRLRDRLLAGHGGNPEIGGNGTAFAGEVELVARRHLAEEGFGVEALADAMAMERSTLYRRVTEETGHPPTVFLRDLRLTEAARLLKDNAGTVSEVAYAVGFQSISYFSRRFKEKFGVSPSEFRL